MVDSASACPGGHGPERVRAHQRHAGRWARPPTRSTALSQTGSSDHRQRRARSPAPSRAAPSHHASPACSRSTRRSRASTGLARAVRGDRRRGGRGHHASRSARRSRPAGAFAERYSSPAQQRPRSRSTARPPRHVRHQRGVPQGRVHPRDGAPLRAAGRARAWSTSRNEDPTRVSRIKVTEYYDGTNDDWIMRLDVLFGWAATYPELATIYAT
jgi:hypothetical protein